MSLALELPVLRDNETIPRTSLEERNTSRFRALVAFVSERSPYYREVIARHDIDPARARPSDFPPLTKEILIERFDDIVTDRRITLERAMNFFARKNPGDALEPFVDDVLFLRTAGSSGRFGIIARTAREVRSAG